MIDQIIDPSTPSDTRARLALYCAVDPSAVTRLTNAAVTGDIKPFVEEFNNWWLAWRWTKRDGTESKPVGSMHQIPKHAKASGRFWEVDHKGREKTPETVKSIDRRGKQQQGKRLRSPAQWGEQIKAAASLGDESGFRAMLDQAAEHLKTEPFRAAVELAGFDGDGRGKNKIRDYVLNQFSSRLKRKEEENEPNDEGSESGDSGDSGDSGGLPERIDDGGDARGSDRRVHQSTEKIVTARADITPKPDTSVVPGSLQQHLVEPQLIGVAAAITAMRKHGGFLLADGTGVGKTRQLLAIAKSFADEGKKVLIVSKPQVFSPDWKKGKFTGSFSSDSEAMAIPVELNDGTKDLTAGSIHLSAYNKLSKLKAKVDSNTVVLWDESHTIKNYNSSATAKHGADISKAAGSVLYASATPSDKALTMTYLNRARLFGTGKWEETWKELGMDPVEIFTGRDTIKTWEVGVDAAEHARRIDGLYRQMTKEGLMIRREISMQGVDVGVNEVKLDPETHDSLDAIRKHYESSDMGPGLKAARTLMSQRLQLEPAKIDQTVAMVKEAIAKGYKPVVFAARVNESEVGDDDGESDPIVSSEGTLKTLKERLEADGITSIAEIHGGVSKAKQVSAMKDFQAGNKDVVIATVESGGTGINLDDTDGSKPRWLICMTAPFSAVENMQMLGRVWRLKTQSYPKVTYIAADHDVDRWNIGLITKKMSTLNATVDSQAKGFWNKDEAVVEPYQWSRQLIKPPAPPAPPKREESIHHNNGSWKKLDSGAWGGWINTDKAVKAGDTVDMPDNRNRTTQKKTVRHVKWSKPGLHLVEFA